jgi:gliding motility-associated-like protein
VMTPDLFIPNVFSPNADGVNDRFLVEYSGDQPFTLEIRDRWGVKLHETRNKLAGWDGVDLKGRAVPPSVYYYRVQVGQREYAGELTLVR